MIVYQTNLEGFYVGSTVADADPVDKTNYLVPAGCVTDAPPALADGQLARWLGDTWEVVTPVVEPEPTPEPADPSIAVRYKRCNLLSLTDWMALSDSPAITADWANYRQALRDITGQAGFPDDVTWPTKPGGL